VATNRSMLDSYVARIVAGPVSFNPREWIYPLLAITKMRLIVLVRRRSQRSPLSVRLWDAELQAIPGAWSHCLQSCVDIVRHILWYLSTPASVADDCRLPAAGELGQLRRFGKMSMR
jgi:hypothetical protein